jgi:hypothetical protein
MSAHFQISLKSTFSDLWFTITVSQFQKEIFSKIVLARYYSDYAKALNLVSFGDRYMLDLPDVTQIDSEDGKSVINLFDENGRPIKTKDKPEILPGNLYVIFGEFNPETKKVEWTVESRYTIKKRR